MAFVALLWFALGACSDTDSPGKSSTDVLGDPSAVLANLPTQLDLGHKIDIIVSIVAYNDNGQWLHEHHKLSSLSIVEPDKYAGIGLMIWHTESPDQDSPWRGVGAIYRIRIAENLLDWVAGEVGYIAPADVEFLEELTIIPSYLRHSTFTSRCWQTLVEKFDNTGFDGLSESGQVYLLVRIADAGVKRGGFHAVWNSPAGEYGSQFAYALAVVGAARKANLFIEFHRVFGDTGVPKGILEREAVHSRLSPSEIETINALRTSYVNGQDTIDQVLQE